MAHFQAGIQGNRGPATRLGTGKSGIYAFARGWDGGARVIMWEQDDQDYIKITIGPHSHIDHTVIVEGSIDKVRTWAQEKGEYRL